MQNTFARESVLKNVLRFSLPYLLSYFLQTLYGMADLLIIGQFDGVAGTTAVSIGSQVMHMVTVMLVGLAMGITVGIGHAVGAGENRRAGSTIGNGAVLFLVLSAALAALLAGLVGPITAIMSTPAEAVAGTRAYLTICFIGIPCITAYNIIAAIYRGLGDSKSPMYFIAVACAANIVLDLVFMGALGMGPGGAALGTTLSQAISVVVSLAAILKRGLDGVQLQKSDFRPRRAIIGRILRVGVPVAMQDGLIQISFLIITVIANRRGLTDAAAVGVVEKFISFVFLVPSSMLSTVSAWAHRKSAQAATTVHRLRCGTASALRWALVRWRPCWCSSSRRMSWGCSPPTPPSLRRARGICAGIFSTASLPGCISVSAGISVPMAAASCRSSITFCPSCSFACRGRT